MLFWTRAFLCIGTVTVLATQRLPQEGAPHTMLELTEPTVALVGEACRARPDLCAAAVTRGFGSLAPTLGRPGASISAAERPRTLHKAPGRDLPVALHVRPLT